jgi:hypothetical protein
MGMYSDIGNLICGKEGVGGPRWNPKTLPFIGCFGLSNGNGVAGAIAGHRIEVAVDADGKQLCKLDGSDAKCSGCIDKDRNCSIWLSVLSHNPDKSVFFYLSRKIGEHTGVTNQENWDAAQKSDRQR